jgi:hypothetical protein
MKEVKTLKRSRVNQCERGSAQHVAMHGYRQIKRGRRPALPFGEIRNPEVAYQAAVARCVVERILSERRPYSMSRPEFTPVSRNVFEVNYWYGYIETAHSMLHAMASAMQGSALIADQVNVPCEPAVFQVSFNRVILRVNATSDKQAFVRDYHRASGGRIPQPVGPVYKLTLSANEQAAEDVHRAKIQRRQDDANEDRARTLREHRRVNAAGHEFDLVDVLAVTTGFCIKGGDHMRGVMEFMTGEGLATLGLATMAPDCRRALIEQHPWLANAKPPKKLTPEDWTKAEIEARWVQTLEGWCAQQVAKHGKMILVKPLPADEPPV